MKKERTEHYRFDSISEAHRLYGLPEPLHPLISLLNGADTTAGGFRTLPHAHVLGFYKISYKPALSGKLRYGQHYYDFDAGGLMFAAPNQLIGQGGDGTVDPCSHAQYTLLIHPDFFLGYPLARKIREYGFFSYAANEALYLSEAEKNTIFSVFGIMDEELHARIDNLSQDVLIAQIELLLNYAQRFYMRQFITRKTANNDLLQQMDDLLSEYFDNERSLSEGLPSVTYFASRLHVSPSYLSDMLRALTGQNAQQHIHQKLIDKAKEKLSTTGLSVSEVAYSLGFEHPQSFSKLFKTKTKMTPLAFRRSFS